MFYVLDEAFLGKWSVSSFDAFDLLQVVRQREPRSTTCAVRVSGLLDAIKRETHGPHSAAYAQQSGMFAIMGLCLA